MRRILIYAILFLIQVSFFKSSRASAEEFSIYNIYKGLNLGNPGEVTQKDFYANIGSNQGVARGSRLLVYRHAPTFDLVEEQFHQEVTFPIAVIQVIHAEPSVSIARLVGFLPADEAASISPKAILVGDLVQVIPKGMDIEVEKQPEIQNLAGVNSQASASGTSSLTVSPTTQTSFSAPGSVPGSQATGAAPAALPTGAPILPPASALTSAPASTPASGVLGSQASPPAASSVNSAGGSTLEKPLTAPLVSTR